MPIAPGPEMRWDDGRRRARACRTKRGIAIMAAKCDILIIGTGSFAARIVFDLAAPATQPLAITIAGRNAERLDWLTLAANARAAIFGRRATFVARRLDLAAPDAAAELLAAERPSVVVQAASAQASSVIATTGD